MVRVERRSGKERRSGHDRRKRSTKGFGGTGRPDSRERRSGKDRRKSPPVKDITGSKKQKHIVAR